MTYSTMGECSKRRYVNSSNIIMTSGSCVYVGPQYLTRSYGRFDRGSWGGRLSCVSPVIAIGV